MRNFMNGKYRFVRRFIFSLSLLPVLVALPSCTLGPAPVPEPVSYDFGAMPVASGPVKFRQSLLVQDIAAPNWMDSPAIFYRLAFRDAARPQAYSGSRWVMPPAILVTNRLRQKMAAASGGVVVPADGIRTSNVLRLEVEDFVQVFDAPGQSRAVVRLRASLLGNRALIAQRTFTIEQPSATPDAEGGVKALTAASEQAIDQIVDWTASQIKG
jgi:cholesterol transport system auxiliary component